MNMLVNNYLHSVYMDLYLLVSSESPRVNYTIAFIQCQAILLYIFTYIIHYFMDYFDLDDTMKTYKITNL